jgi:hypothetical protein
VVNRAGLEPGVELASQAWTGVDLGQSSGWVDPLTACFDSGVEDVCGCMAHGRVQRRDRLVTGSPWSNAIAVGGNTRFPCRFAHVCGHRLAGAIRHGGDSQGPCVRRARCWSPGASDWAGRPLAGERRGSPQALGGRQGVHAVHPCRLVPASVLGDPPDGEARG